MFFNKLRTSISKIIIPFFYIILKFLKSNSRGINYLIDKNIKSNDAYNFETTIKQLLGDKKIVALDAGAQGGFNSDNFFSKRYIKYFEAILVDPFKDSLSREQNKFIINEGLWSSECKKKFYILNKRPQSSSMYEPDTKSLSIYNFKDKDLDLFNVDRTEIVNCNTLSSSLENLKISDLDYLKIDTQGAELEIIKGLGNFRPLMIKCELQIFPMYKQQPSWTEVTNLLYKLGYILTDWKKIGSSATRAPVEMDMIFIPNFKIDDGKNLILKKEKVFISLMLVSGQIKLLQKISKILSFKYSKDYINIEDKFFQ